MMKRFGKALSILLALALAFACTGFCAAAEEEPPQSQSAEATVENNSGSTGETVSGEEAVAEAVSGETVPETGGTGEEAAAETEKTEASSEGMPLEEATEQPAGPAEDGAPENPSEDPSGTETENGEEADPLSESGSEPEKEPADKPEETEDEPEDGPEDEPEETETVLNLNGCKTISGILTKEAPFSLKASDDYSRMVVFTLTVPTENAVSVLLDHEPVSLAEAEKENPDDTDFRYTFEIPLLAGQDYPIILKAETDGEIPFTLSIRKKPDESREEEENSETPEKATDEAETGAETDSGTESEAREFPDDFAIHFHVSWDGEELHFGDTAHFYVTAEGDDGIDYYIVWQWSEDNENWNTVEDENGKELDLTVTEDNYLWYWRIKARMRDPD